MDSYDDDSPTNRERELQALVQSKEAELEERGRLLYKTKVAIEQLQQELAASKRDAEVLRERAARAQEQLEQQEEELTARDQEAHANEQDVQHYAAESNEYQMRLASAEEDRMELQERVEAMADRLKEAEQAATAARAEAHVHLDRAAQLEEELRSQGATLANLQEQLVQVSQEQEDNEQVVREVVRKHKTLQEEYDGTFQALEATRQALEQSRQRVSALESTLNNERAQHSRDQQEVQTELVQVQRDARQRVADAETRLEAMSEQMEERLAEIQAQHEKDRRNAEVSEKSAKAAAQKQLEDMRAQFQAERSSAEAAWAVAKAETQQQWMEALQELQRKAAEQLTQQLDAERQEHASAAKAWQEQVLAVNSKLEAADRRLTDAQDRYEAHRSAQHQKLVEAEAKFVALEGTWQRRLLESEGGVAALKAEVHAKLLLVSERLEGLVTREARHASRRSQLVMAVEALRKAGQAEGERHRQAEATMQDAVALFKTELAEKSARLASLQADLRQLKDWQMESIKCLRRGQACPPSPARLRHSPERKTILAADDAHHRTPTGNPGIVQKPMPLHENGASAGFTVWGAPGKQRPPSRRVRHRGTASSRPHSAWTSCTSQGHASDEDVYGAPLRPPLPGAQSIKGEQRHSGYTSPHADAHVHLRYKEDPPKQVQKWCQTLTDELGRAMHHLQESLSPERSRNLEAY